MPASLQGVKPNTNVYRFITSGKKGNCELCHALVDKLEAHHIKNFADNPELRFAVNNGITLSKKAHREFHKIYGTRNNNKKQLDKFLLNN